MRRAPWLAATLAALALLGIGTACDNRVEIAAADSADSADSDDMDQAAEAQEIDTWVEEDLAESDGHAEARGWLASDEHTTVGASKGDVQSLVEALYSAGATKVHVTGIEAIAGRQMTASLVATLPDNSFSRIRLFDVEAKFYQLSPDETTKDVGQRYLNFGLE